MTDRSRIPWLFTGLGVALALVVVWEFLYILLVSNPLGLVWVAGLVTSLPFTLGLVYAGFWLPGSVVSADQYTRVGYWCVGGLCVFGLVNVTIMFTMLPDSVLRAVSWGRWAATLGAGLGLGIGIFEARGIERALEAERERVRAQEAEDREDLLAYLNATLRHEILNTATVIVGNADIVREECDADGTIPDRMETIKSHAQEMEDVIEDVRTLLYASEGTMNTEPTDVTELLTEELTTLRDTVEPVTIETSMPEQALVRANDALGRAFENLLRNAVEHNDGDTPRVEVTVTRNPGTVVVRIADNGPGIPESERESLFVREIRVDSNHGLGLMLAKELLTSYDGTIELTDTGPDGTEFTITLPREQSALPEKRDADAQQTRPEITG